eukprot:9494150-Pyramimonas_sp.AAC.3
MHGHPLRRSWCFSPGMGRAASTARSTSTPPWRRWSGSWSPGTWPGRGTTRGGNTCFIGAPLLLAPTGDDAASGDGDARDDDCFGSKSTPTAMMMTTIWQAR